jgi:NitT/TauT family transport system ATP-binding protein
MALLRAEGLSFSYGEQPAVHDLDLDVRERELLCVTGRTGVGKTTVARLLAGILRPDAGTVTCDGRPVAGTRDLVSFVPQQPSLMPWRTVAQNVALAFELATDRPSARERRRRTADLLDRVGLADFGDYLPAQVSGGMRQRTAVARAFASVAPILVMDEPFSALDVQTRLRLEAELLRLAEDDRRTIVFFTNDHDEALTLGDRIVAIGGPPATDRGAMDVDLPRPRSSLADDLIALRPRVLDLARGVAA